MSRLYISFFLVFFFWISGNAENVSVEKAGKGYVYPFGDNISISSDSLQISLKPAEQYYLKKIVLFDAKGDAIQTVERALIRAERNDTLYYTYTSIAGSSVSKILCEFDSVLVWNGTPSNEMPYHNEDSAYYQIYTSEELAWIGKAPKQWSDSLVFSIQNDFDLGGSLTPPKNWITIGELIPSGYNTKRYAFSGSILGNNKTLANIYQTYISSEYTEGLFFIFEKGMIKDWHILNGKMRTFAFTAGKDASLINCSNGADVDRRSVAVQLTENGFILSFVNFGDMTGFLSSCIQLGNSFRVSASKSINWGDLSVSQRAGIAFDDYGGNSVCTYNFNFGRVGSLLRSIGMINGTSVNNFSSFDLSPHTSVYKFPSSFDTTHSSYKTNQLLTSRQMTDSAYMRNLMGEESEEYYVFENGFYPRLKNMDERPGRLAASPILFHSDNNADGITRSFYVDTNYGVRWRSLSPGLIDIQGDSGRVMTKINMDSVVRVEATLKGFTKHVYLKVPAYHIHHYWNDDTICQGDSLKFIHRYLYTSGHHTDTVPGPERLSIDTVYHVNLYIHPTYRDTTFVSIERDSLPYISGQDTIRSFGLHTLYSGNTVEACDSVRYLKLGLPCTAPTPKIIPYTGCVNLGMRDTITLQVEPDSNTTAYTWTIPETWRIIGCETCDSITVLTQEENEIERTYSVQADNGCLSKSIEAMDEVNVRGADIIVVIRELATVNFIVRFPPNQVISPSGDYSFFWHKDSITSVGMAGVSIAQNKISPSNPVLQYKHKASACWSVAKNVYIPKANDTLSICGGDSAFWQGTYYKTAGDYTYEDRIHYDCVDTIYKDRLHLKVNPTYRDTTFVSIERDSLPYISGQDTIRSFGLHTLYSGNTVEACDSVRYLKLGLPCTASRPKIIPYTGCVNLGMRDTIELKVEADASTQSYEWSLPDTWSILGCDTCSTIRVITHDFKKQAQVYGVIAKNDCVLPSEEALDSLWIRGTDTTMVIVEMTVRFYTMCFLSGVSMATPSNYGFSWYKTSVSGNSLGKGLNISQGRINPSNPVLQYKHRDSACWSVAKNVYIPKANDTLSICGGDSAFWQGAYYKKAGDYTYEARTHYDCVDTIYKDRLHLKVNPTYRDTTFVSIERDSLPYILGQDTIRSFGLHTLYSGNTVEACDSVRYLKLGLPCTAPMPKIIPYTGCVNLGMRDTIELKVVSNADIISYKWFLPDTWSILGCDTCATIKVITHDFKKQAQVYGVIAKNDCVSPSEKALDSIWIKGTDTMVVIIEQGIRLYTANFYPKVPILQARDYSLCWYKDSIDSNQIASGISIAQPEISPSNPVLQYKHKSSACWSVAKNVYIPKANDTLSICGGDSAFWQGAYYKKASDYTYEDRIHYDCVDTIYKDRLHLKVNPTYRDTTFVSIERDSLPYILGQDTIRSFGLHTLYSGNTVEACDSVRYLRLDTLDLRYTKEIFDTLSGCSDDSFLWRSKYYKTAGDYTDTLVDPYKGGTDSIYHLNLTIYPAYHDTTYASIERDSLPYIFGTHSISNFGWHIFPYQTINACDSIQVLKLDTLYIRRSQSFFDSLSRCSGDSLLWRSKYYKIAGDYTDTLIDPYKGGTDSIFHLNLTIYPAYHDTTFVSIERDSLPYLFGTHSVQSFGWHSFPYQTINACDSIQVLKLDTLYIRRSQSFFDSLSRCSGDSLLWRSKYYKIAGDYTDTLIDPYKGGTDSIYHLNLSIHPSYQFSFTDSCHKDSLPYTFHGYSFTDFGEKEFVYTSENGCDSIVHLTLLPIVYSYTLSIRTSEGGRANIEEDTTLTEGHSLSVYFYPEACYKLDSLFMDEKSIKAVSPYMIENISKDHSIRAVFSLKEHQSNLWFVLCPYELPLLYNGKHYAVGEHQILLQSFQGCDSTIFLSIKQKQNISQLEFKDSIPFLCGDALLEIGYRQMLGQTKTIQIQFSENAHTQGFSDTLVSLTSFSTFYRTLKLPVPQTLAPDRYSLQLSYADSSACFAGEQNIEFEVRYPNTIIQQKWDDLLAVQSAPFNGGYTFSAYQWFCNNHSMPGETKSYIYQKPYLNRKNIYEVLLTRASDNLIMKSCPIQRVNPPKVLNVNLQPNPSPEDKSPMIWIEGAENTRYQIYILDGSGKKIYQGEAQSGSHQIPISPATGIYIIRIENPDQSEGQSVKWVVR